MKKYLIVLLVLIIGLLMLSACKTGRKSKNDDSHSSILTESSLSSEVSISSESSISTNEISSSDKISSSISEDNTSSTIINSSSTSSDPYETPLLPL